ncbi:putative RNA-directed DNA polymerase from transposon X-element [Nephila pilipes]|uniref:Putative RNA-directed DNA polymerase from transposon X-element n=1 Tax=Nephila pilipes TaxID=299642 RepID=A0A8X6KE94_NEPPI|nr:putative RNA-directed DNA polymerase from transposon X-element [Nephila pilipes]
MLPEDKKLRVVILGMPIDMPPEEIAQELKDQNIIVDEKGSNRLCRRRDSITSEELASAPCHTTVIEGTAITLERRNKASITIISAYKPPRKPILQTDLTNLFANRRDVLVFGYLNAKYHTWNTNGNNNQGKQIYEYAKNKNLRICAPVQPIRLSHRFKNAVIDICIAKGFEGISAESIPALSSDHNPVLFTIEVDDIKKNNANAIQFTNWNVFQLQLKHLIPGNPKIFTTQEIDLAIENFSTQYNNAIIIASKTKIIHNQGYTLPPPLRRKIKLKKYYPETLARDQGSQV